jgi:excisionase family DNA binding protein
MHHLFGPAVPTELPARGLTVAELAKLLRVGRSKIRRWIAEGQLRAVDLGDPGRPRLVITPDRLEAFLKGREAPAK